MKILDRFCKQLAKCDELYNSEEVKIFMCSYEAKKSLNSLSDEKYEQILEKYKKVYKPVPDGYDIQVARNGVNNFFVFLKKKLSHLRNFKEIVQGILARKEKEIENYSSLMNIFSDYEKNTIIEYTEKSHDSLIFNNSENEINMKFLQIVKNF
jgi:hypothetical protein